MKSCVFAAVVLLFVTATAPAQESVTSVYTIDAAIKASEKLATRKVSWSGATALQKQWLSIRSEIADDKTPASLEAFASHDVREVNRFLQRKGMTIQLPRLAQRQIAAAAVLDVSLQWRSRGTQSKLELGSRTYPGFILPFGPARLLKSDDHKHPIAEIGTTSAEKVFVTAWDGTPPKGFALAKLAAKLTKNAQPLKTAFKGIHLPKVDLAIQSRLSWLEGLRANDGTSLATVLTQTKLKMNQDGCRATTATATSWPRSKARYYQMDRAFVFWVMGKDQTYPIFCVHVPVSAWKDPRNLD